LSPCSSHRCASGLCSGLINSSALCWVSHLSPRLGSCPPKLDARPCVLHFRAMVLLLIVDCISPSHPLRRQGCLHRAVRRIPAKTSSGQAKGAAGGWAWARRRDVCGRGARCLTRLGALGSKSRALGVCGYVHASVCSSVGGLVSCLKGLRLVVIMIKMRIKIQTNKQIYEQW
jgi:hypothetical protein